MQKVYFLKELSHHVEEYKSVLPDNEDTEWEDVVKEIEQFPDVRKNVHLFPLQFSFINY